MIHIASIMTLPVAAFCMGMMTRNAGSRWADCVKKTKALNDTATTEIYTLSLHDALPIYCGLDRIINFEEVFK